MCCTRNDRPPTPTWRDGWHLARSRVPSRVEARSRAHLASASARRVSTTRPPHCAPLLCRNRRRCPSKSRRNLGHCAPLVFASAVGARRDLAAFSAAPPSALASTPHGLLVDRMCSRDDTCAVAWGSRARLYVSRRPSSSSRLQLVVRSRAVASSALSLARFRAQRPRRHTWIVSGLSAPRQRFVSATFLVSLLLES